MRGRTRTWVSAGRILHPTPGPHLSRPAPLAATSSPARGGITRLQPDEWTSGDIIWLIDVVSDEPTAGALIQQMLRGPFKGRAVSIATRDAAGRVEIETLHAVLAAQAPPPATP